MTICRWSLLPVLTSIVFATACQTNGQAPVDSAGAYRSAIEDGRRADTAGLLTQVLLARRIRAALERAVALDSTNVEARSELVRYDIVAPRLLGGSRRRAAAEAAELSRWAPERSLVLAAWAHRQLGEPGPAGSEFRLAITRYPNSPAAYFGLAVVCEDQSRSDEAIALLHHGLALDPGYVRGHLQLGGLSARIGAHLAEGESALTYVLTHTTDTRQLALAHFALGTVYDKEQKPDRAATEYEAAVRLRPENGDYAAALARVRGAQHATR